MRYGLIGANLSYSHSPRIHAMLGNYDYALYPLSPEELPAFLARDDLGGLNVTIPYKVEVLRYCARLSDEAKRIGSINTLLYDENRRITGHNTDCAGIRYMARRAGIGLLGKKVVILGSGGTSRTAAVAAQDAGAGEIVVVSRAGENNYQNISRHADADILFNATPVGTYPELSDSPVELSAFPRLAGVIDVIYNPLRSRLVADARARGIPATGGLPMLVAQAHGAAELFTGNKIDEARIGEILGTLAAALSNIVLIGMPGAGKTSVGTLLAQRMDRKFFDTDALIERDAGLSIPEIFAREGEVGFRARERAAIKEAAQKGGRVIATGGGAPLFEENRRMLKQNGRVFFLERALDRLAVDGRPLSKDLPAMYERRAPVYRAFADAAADNNGSVEAAADAILRAFEADA